jgi:threonine dehydrogenase-like Zn-dependent dehydrogenase
VHVTAAGRSPAKLELAASLGAERTVQLGGHTDTDAATLLADGPPHGFDVVLQCAGSAKLDQLAIMVAAPGGRVVAVGASQEPFSLRAVDLIWRELTVTGSRGFTLSDISDVVDLYLEGLIDVSHLVDHVRPLSDINAALDDLQSGSVLRSIIDPQM